MRLFARAALAAVIAFACLPALAKDDLITPANPGGDPRPVVLVKKGGDGICSAFYIGGNKFLTAGHCMNDNTAELKLWTDNDKGGDYTFRITKFAYSAPQNWNGLDFAVLFGDPDVTAKLPALPVDCSGTVTIGEAIQIEGFPGDLGRMRVTGNVASYKATPFAADKGGWSQPVWRLSLPITYGNSGSAILDATSGKVIGILVGAEPSNRTLSAMQPIAPVCEILGLSK